MFSSSVYCRQCILNQIMDQEKVCLWRKCYRQTIWNSRKFWLHRM